jgi:hypothetical protein
MRPLLLGMLGAFVIGGIFVGGYEVGYHHSRGHASATCGPGSSGWGYTCP